ncbi:hypothetical protein D3C78_1547500 [compost metagenome]
MAATPTSSGCATGCLRSGLICGGCAASGMSPPRRPRSSSGSPRPLTMRPSQLLPIISPALSAAGITRAPVLSPTGFLNGIR